MFVDVEYDQKSCSSLCLLNKRSVWLGFVEVTCLFGLSLVIVCACGKDSQTSHSVQDVYSMVCNSNGIKCCLGRGPMLCLWEEHFSVVKDSIIRCLFCHTVNWHRRYISHSAWVESSPFNSPPPFPPSRERSTLYIILYTHTQFIVFQYVVVKVVVKSSISIWCWFVISCLHQQSLWRHDNALNDARHSDASAFPPPPQNWVVRSFPYFAHGILWMTPKTLKFSWKSDD